MTVNSEPKCDHEIEKLLLSLGGVRAAFGPSKVNLAAGVIVGIFFVCFGCFVCGFFIHESFWPWRFQQGNELNPWFGVPMSLVLLVLISGLGVWVLFDVWTYARRRIAVCENGLLEQNAARPEVYAYDHIEFVRENIRRYRPPIVGPPLSLLIPKFKSRSWYIVRFDGNALHIDRNTVWNQRGLVEMLKPECERRGIPWHVVERG